MAAPVHEWAASNGTAMTVNRRNVLLAGAGLLRCLGFLGSSLSTAFGEKKDGLEELFVNRDAMYFVAIGGSDNGPGTADRPWATINYAAQRATAGDTVVVRGGHHTLTTQIRVRNSGRSDAWITFLGYPGEEPILDAELVQYSALASLGLDNGVFQIEDVSYVRVINLHIINSHDAGFAVRDASHIDLINNSTTGTFSSGIAVWDTNHDDNGTEHIRIIGNSVTKAASWNFAPNNVSEKGEAPHEAISIGGAVGFEVAYNHIYDSEKEGIDIKETSKRGKVHHNFVDRVHRQGIYVDAWFGEISDIEISSNVISNCGAGLVISVENGKSVDMVNAHNNLIFNNKGSGIYFSRWGVDGLRNQIQIRNNTVYRNGYGPPKSGQTYYWMPGGLYLYSVNVREILISNNIFSDNCGFQIGLSELFFKNRRALQSVAREQKIQILANLLHGQNIIGSPIRSGGNPADRVNIYALNGKRAIFGNPLFKDPAEQDFTLGRNSPAAIGHGAGAYPQDGSLELWWKRNFPPRLVRTNFAPDAHER